MTRINLGIEPRELCDSHLHRGFEPQYRRAPAAARRSTLRAPTIELDRARPLLQERILGRLPTMRRVVWTGREIPDWVRVVRVDAQELHT